MPIANSTMLVSNATRRFEALLRHAVSRVIQ
jgi:hypothetical protein